MTIVLRDQLSPGLAALAITYIMMIGDSTRLDHDDHDDDNDIYIMMSVCLSEKSSLLGFSWFLVGFHGF